MILIGGRLYKHSIVSVSAAQVEAISHSNRSLFYGRDRRTPTAGLSTGDLEATIKRAGSRAAETVVLACAARSYPPPRSMRSAILRWRTPSSLSGLPMTLIAPLQRAGVSVLKPDSTKMRYTSHYL